MSLPASTLRILLKHGVDADAIVEAAEAAEAEAAAEKEARLAKRRDSNRRRQRAWYDRNVRNCDDSVQANQDNAVMQREEREDQAEQRPPTPPKTTPEDITPPLPSEATAPLPSKPRQFDWPSDFEDRFWASYPRKTDRKKAMVSLNRVRRADKTAFETVMDGVDRMVASGIDVGFVPHPTTFLNNERWNDEWPRRSNGARASPGGRSSTQQSFLDAANGYHRELTEASDDEGPFAHSGRHAPADGYRNGHAGSRYDEPAGERLRLAPPRLAGPTRPH